MAGCVFGTGSVCVCVCVCGQCVVVTITCPSLQSSPPSCHRGAACLLITCTTIKGAREGARESE